MKYEFLSRVFIKAEKKNSTKKVWLTIGIVCCALVAIIGLLVRRFDAGASIIPMIYFIILRRTYGAKSVCKDAPAIFQYENDLVRIQFSGIVKLPDSSFGSTQYIFPLDKMKELAFDTKTQMVAIKAETNVHTLNVSSQSISNYTYNELIKFSIPTEYQDRILECLSQKIPVIRT